MRRSPLFPLWAILCLAVSVAAPRADEDRLEHLYDLMRIEEGLRGWPEAIMQSLDQTPGAWSAGQPRQAASEAAQRIFAAGAMARDVRALSAGALSLAQIEAAIAFYETDLGSHVAALEVAASDPAMRETVEAEGRRLHARMVAAGDARPGQIDRMIASAQAVERGVAMIMNMSLAMSSAMLAAEGSAMAMPEEDILAAINAAAPQIRADLAESYAARLAFIYRDLDDAAMERYVDHLETTDGRAVSSAFLAALRMSVVARARAFGAELGALLGQRRG